MAVKKSNKKNSVNGGNELAQRLGAVAAPKKTKVNKSNGGSIKGNNKKTNKKEPINPLLARIDALQKVHNGQSKNNNSSILDNPLAQRIRIVDSKQNRPKGPSSKVKFTAASISKQTQALQSSRLKKQNKITKELPKKNKKSSNQIRNPTILKIKNASNPKFLKIKNLEYGTSINDLRTVLESIGKTKLIRINDLESGSSMAEVAFSSESILETAHIQLNGALADGRKLRTEISNESEIPTQVNHNNGPRVYKSKN
ncbi:Polyadenylate-binding protein [Wickerhamomyces ciferrii]|uniref:Polyadenylate-binding protein n=1 Tax=Wickerhamomyces ciferrii (strain ATCC 14091 / BCRC 22168 / CBS 111 / JCM 3599 / NBRC 0793 / NRRL Y-1031 F-60-10) TaxID=1206466 RepID=K0KQM6_WICCF|nr:Polyadenylate-binding protein [Wickerhamomyces ciferrii]CCH43568.1 Polyadenylate-binding protein [Wickerhamomyces ciferrii]